MMHTLPVSWVKVAQAPKGASVNSRPGIDQGDMLHAVTTKAVLEGVLTLDMQLSVKLVLRCSSVKVVMVTSNTWRRLLVWHHTKA